MISLPCPGLHNHTLTSGHVLKKLDGDAAQGLALKLHSNSAKAQRVTCCTSHYPAGHGCNTSLPSSRFACCAVLPHLLPLQLISKVLLWSGHRSLTQASFPLPTSCSLRSSRLPSASPTAPTLISRYTCMVHRCSITFTFQEGEAQCVERVLQQLVKGAWGACKHARTLPAHPRVPNINQGPHLVPAQRCLALCQRRGDAQRSHESCRYTCLEQGPLAEALQGGCLAGAGIGSFMQLASFL